MCVSSATDGFSEATVPLGVLSVLPHWALVWSWLSLSWLLFTAHLCGDPIDLWPPGVLAFSPSGCPRKRLDLHVKTDSSAVSLHPHFHVCIRAGPTPSWKRVSQTATHQHPFLQHLGKLRGGGHRDPRGIAWVFGSQAPPRLVKET